MYSSLPSADLSRAYLQRADLTGADLTGANLRRALLDETDLSGAVLTFTDLRGAYLEKAKIKNADFTDARLDCYGWLLTHGDGDDNGAMSADVALWFLIVFLAVFSFSVVLITEVL
jgi:hypothetical protein